MKFNYKKMLEKIDKAGACARQLRPFAYLVEHEMYEEARELFGWWSDSWLIDKDVIGQRWKSMKWVKRAEELSVERIIYYNGDGSLANCLTIDEDYDGSGEYQEGLTTKGREEVFNNPKYIIPPDYKYTRLNGNVI